MMDPEDIYYYFRKAQANSKNRGFRMPKDFESHLEKRFSIKNKEYLLKATDYFNTKWNNIDPYVYFKCGFELLKTFSYINFFDPRVIRLYIQRDKNTKRELSNCKKEIAQSVVFIRNYMNKNGIIIFDDYINKTVENKKIIVTHYLKNKVSKFFIVWMLKIGKLYLSDSEISFMPYISDQYREIRLILETDDIRSFLRKVKSRL